MSLTTDKNDPGINKPKGEGRQNESYIILSKEEREKGFIRPVRNSYKHLGRFYEYWEEMTMLDEVREESGKKYVAKVPVVKRGGDKGLGVITGSSLLTQKEVDNIKATKGYRSMCGATTIMAKDIAETYARDPHFYGSTWCMSCRDHINVGEFVWDGTDEKVGS